MNPNNNSYFPMDLDKIKTKEFAAIVYKYMHENNLYSTRYILLKDLFRKLMGVPHNVAGRGQWFIFKYLFSRARTYLAADKRLLKIYITPRRVTTLTQVPNSSKRVGIVGYSIANRPSDFKKVNDILMEIIDGLKEGMRKNIRLAEEMEAQQQLKTEEKSK